MKKSMEDIEARIQEVLAEREASALVWLCDISREAYAPESVHTEENYDALYAQLEGMPLKKVDTIQDIVTLLCREQEQEGFVRGFLLGMKLSAEIEKRS